jgi:hypothetical protein
MQRRIPKLGEHAGRLGHFGTFVVSKVDHQYMTVELELIPLRYHTMSGVTWGTLMFWDQVA